MFSRKRISPFKAISLIGDSVHIIPNNESSYFINHWFAECPPCIAEIPNINKLQKDNPLTKFVAINRNNVIEDTALIRKHEFFVSHLLIPDALNAQTFPETGYPTSYILNKNLEIVYVFNSIREDQWLQVDSILKSIN